MSDQSIMLKRYLEQRHIDLDSGRSCLGGSVSTGKHFTPLREDCSQQSDTVSWPPRV